MSGPHVHQKQAVRSYIGLLAATICVFTIEYTPQPMLVSISRDLGVERSLTGLLISVFMLSLTVSPLCVGMLLGKIGIRRTILGSMVLLGASGIGIWFAPSFSWLLGIRVFQALLQPLIITSVMTAIASLFRHMNLPRALAGYITASLVGSLSGRILGGLAAEHLGWRLSLSLVTALCAVALVLLVHLPEIRQGSHKVHRPREYATVLRQPGVPALILMDACGLFVFAAVGNLLPFRMAELGMGQSEGVIGLMYAGYSIGFVSSLSIGPLLRLFGRPTRLLLFGTIVFALGSVTLFFPTVWVLFGGVWIIAFGQILVHALSPGLLNAVATRSGECERSLVNGLFLSSVYFGGALGSYFPGLIYSQLGWTACYGLLQGILIFMLFVAFWLAWRMPDLH